MNLSLKVQQIQSTETGEGYFSIAHEFSVEDQDTISKRGKLFLILEISTQNHKLNLPDLAKIFIDALSEDYFKINDQSPLHAIENSLKRAQKILKDSSNDPSLKCSFATALVWNRVLYTSHHGNPAIYLVRGTGVRNLVSNKEESEIWTSSGIIDDDDVIILGTESVSEAFPSGEIANSLGNLTQTISSQKNSKMAVLLIKVQNPLEKEPAKKVYIKSMNLKALLTNNALRLKSLILFNEPLSSKFKLSQSKKTAPVSSITSISGQNAPEISVGTNGNPKRLNKTLRIGSKRRKAQITTGVLILALLILANFSLSKEETANNISKDNINSILSIGNKPIEPTVIGAQTSEIPNLHKQIINTSLISQDFLLKDLASYKEKVFVLDSNNGEISEIDTQTGESRAVIKGFEDPLFIKCDSKLCYVYGNQKLYVFNPLTPDKKDEYLIEVPEGQTILDINSMSNNVLFLTPEKIFFLPLGTKNISLTEWADLENKPIDPVSLTVLNSSVFVLGETELFKFRSGKLDGNFILADGSILKGVDITSKDNYVYILDSGMSTKQLFTIDAGTGNLVKTIETADKMDSEQPSFIALTDNNISVFAKGGYLYRIESEDKKESGKELNIDEFVKGLNN